jgi:predicted ATPase
MSQATHRPIEQIITSIAEKEGIDPVEMTPPLGEVIDSDAVKTLLNQEPTNSGEQLEIHFTYFGYDIVASANGDIEIQ